MSFRPPPPWSSSDLYALHFSSINPRLSSAAYVWASRRAVRTMAAASGGKYVPPSRRAGYIPPSAPTLPPGHSPRQPPPTARPREPVYPLSNIENAFNSPQHSSINFYAYRYPMERSVERRPERLWRPKLSEQSIDDAQEALSNLQISTSGQEAEPHASIEDPVEIDATKEAPAVSDYPPKPPAPSRQYPTHPLEHLISYITLFPNAHPAWATDKELWTHTSSQKLVEDWKSGEKINFGRPLPVFRAASARRGPMVFDGWWILDALHSVKANSDELREMLVTKEQAKSYVKSGRTAEAWNESLKQRWIKLRLFPAPPERWPDLKNPMNMLGGLNGEVEAYMLDLAELTDEKAKLAEAHEQQRKFDEETKVAVFARRGMQATREDARQEGPDGGDERA